MRQPDCRCLASAQLTMISPPRNADLGWQSGRSFALSVGPAADRVFDVAQNLQTGQNVVSSRPVREQCPNGIPSHQGAQPLDLLRIIIAILLPPLGVFLQEGIGKHFWINILLTLLGYIPGIIHAIWIITKR